jgi:N-acyl-D-aspartate/D-glutamate deacylase
MIQVPWDKDLWRRVGKSVDRYNAAGTEVRMQVFNRPVGMVLGLDTTFNPFSMNPLYAEHIAHLPVAEQVARMRDPEVRRQLLEPGAAIDHPLAFNLTRFGEMYPMGEYAEYEPDPTTAIGAQAEARGVSALEVAYDALLAQDGAGKILVASTNFDDGHLDTTLELMRHEHAVVALGDGGAHAGLICDSSYSTFMLSHWARDRKRDGRLSIEEAVRMMTDKPAKLQRFHDRGRIAPGLRADLNVIDMDKLKLFTPHVIHDLPAGGRRLTQRADGYVATYVAGTAIRREGEDLGKRPGKLIRNAGI